MQKSSRSSGHQSSRHRSRDKSRDRDQDRDRDKDWPPEKLSDSHSPVSLKEQIEAFSGWNVWFKDGHRELCHVPFRASHWSHCASSFTFHPHPPTRTRPLICATSHYLIQPRLKVVSQKAGVTQGLVRPSWRADRQPTRFPDSWSLAGIHPPWAALRATPTQSKWASREARTGTDSDAPPDLECQTSMTWKRRLCDLCHLQLSQPLQTPLFPLCCSYTSLA